MTGNGDVQTRSGRCYRPCSTGSSPSPSDATTPHREPDQNQSRQRAVHHTSGCTVLACLDAEHQYTPTDPKVSALTPTASGYGSLVKNTFTSVRS
jgi:hypothetical protein